MKLLTLKHNLTLEALSLGTAVAPLLHHYRTSLAESTLGNRIELDLELAYVGDAKDCWAAVPQDKEIGYHRAMTLVSVEIQKALRAWVGCLWCSDAENLRDTERTTQVAAYLALRPHYPKAKHAYSYDALETHSVASVHRSIKINMGDSLSAIWTQLRLLGEHDLADFYAPKHAAWFAEAAMRSPKLLFNILARENKLIRGWAPMLGLDLDAQPVEELREEIASNLRGFIRRDDDWRFLTPAIEMEATAGLEAYLLRPAGRQLRLRARPADSPLARTSPRPLARVIEFPRAA